MGRGKDYELVKIDAHFLTVCGDHCDLFDRCNASNESLVKQCREADNKDGIFHVFKKKETTNE
jgi:hypothetical protein